MNVDIWLTRGNQTALLQKQTDTLTFSEAKASYPTIQIAGEKTYQSMDGFGFALTGGSAHLINRLDPTARDALLRELFSTEEEAIGISYLRISMGASDLSTHSFSYDDLPQGQIDPELERFNLDAGDVEVIPVLRQILAINPGITIMATPWSAPPWMKTNQSFIGGELKPEYYPVYARYFVRYLEAMRECGITVHALSPQNEPLNLKNEPSMVMPAEDQATFIKNHLGPALQAAGLQVEIFCWDHNCDVIDYPLTVLADDAARQYISGVAWHLYGGEIEALSAVQALYPDKKMVFTEQWVGRDGHFDGDLNWHARHVLIGATRNWSRLVLEWNLASDPDCGPHTAGGEPNCVGALTVDDAVTRNVAYYIVAHAAKFVPPGSMRIESTFLNSLPNVAFKRPDGGTVLIVLNDGAENLAFNIEYNEKWVSTSLDSGALATYIWR